MDLRENWRIVLLLVFCIGSTAVLFAPMVMGGGDGGSGLEYGLELSGGTRIRAPLVGMTAEEVNTTNIENQSGVRRDLADRLNVASNDIRFGARTVEVFSDNVSRQEFATALQANGFDAQPDNVRDGVTAATREEVVRTLNDKINRGGLTGGGARTTTSGTGQNFVVVEVPNANRSEVLNLIRGSGEVFVTAHYPVQQNGTTSYEQTRILDNEDFAVVGTARSPQGGQPEVPVTLKTEAADRFVRVMVQNGFTGEGVANCPTNVALQNPDNASGWCLYTVQDGDVVYAAQMSRDLAGTLESGDFQKDPRFTMTTNNISEAQQLQINLNAGALPTELNISAGTNYFLQPSLAQEFKLFSLLTGLVAWIAVAGMVFLRYGSPRVAIPMLLTAVAEVFLLLGFASAIGLALDLSHIAGFIAVIGTGVDDLIIIADEILQEGKVATGRVFQNRFRKAFWVIGAAAATTIIAMSPLTVLSLGDLTGFAIVTIVGVLIGVLVTRPAYGDILRNLMLDQDSASS
jgi:preprotein translocase subunit SecD